MRIAFCLAVLASTRFAGAGSDGEWYRLVAKAQAEQSQAKYEEAEGTFRAALALAEQQPAWLPKTRSLSYLARVEQTLGKSDEAEGLYKRALALSEEHDARLDSAAILINLSRLDRAHGHANVGLPKCLKAVEIFRRTLGPQHAFVADSLDTLASLQVSLGKDLEAFRTYQESLSIRQSAAHPDDLKLASTLADFAALQTTLGSYTSAERDYHRALILRERRLGDAHPEVADTRLGLAVVYRNLRQFSKADGLVDGVLPVLEATLGLEHARVANAAQEIASLYIDEGRAAEANHCCGRRWRFIRRSTAVTTMRWLAC